MQADKYAIQACRLPQYAFMHKSQPFGQRPAGVIAGRALQFDAVQLQRAKRVREDGAHRPAGDAPALELLAQVLADAGIAVRRVDVLQTDAAAQGRAGENMPFHYLAAGRAGDGGLQIGMRLAACLRLQHGGQVSTQARAVVRHRFGEGFGVFRQGWNNRNIRKF